MDHYVDRKRQSSGRDRRLSATKVEPAGSACIFAFQAPFHLHLRLSCEPPRDLWRLNPAWPVPELVGLPVSWLHLAPAMSTIRSRNKEQTRGAAHLGGMRHEEHSIVQACPQTLGARRGLLGFSLWRRQGSGRVRCSGLTGAGARDDTAGAATRSGADPRTGTGTGTGACSGSGACTCADPRTGTCTRAESVTGSPRVTYTDAVTRADQRRRGQSGGVPVDLRHEPGRRRAGWARRPRSTSVGSRLPTTATWARPR